jgi:sterol desaturase/sphingolipid hydroxylase (fatty acid hydroxylase superfamily)
MPALAALVLALLERIPATRFRPARLLRAHLATDAVYLVTGYVAAAPLVAWYVTAAGGWVGARTGVPALLWPAVPFPAQVVVALVAIDLGNYGAHWALHRWDVLWAFHQAHHSSRHLDWMATFRSHAVEHVIRRLLAPLLLVAAGVPAPAVGVAAGIFFAWAMLNHANVRLPLGWVEAVLVTPRLHRVHHVPATTERNLGTVFTWWDRLRGTLVLDDPPSAAELGLPRGRDTYPQDWVRQLVAPWTRVERATARRAAPDATRSSRSAGRCAAPR